MKLSEIINRLEEKFPRQNAESWDNVGLLIGNRENEIKKIQISLDVTMRVIENAVENNVDLIISHHPFIFSPIKDINNDSITGRKILKLIENKIAVYSLHTNLDSSFSGLNDFLGEKLGFVEGKIIDPIKDNLLEEEISVNGIGRVYTLSQREKLTDIIKTVKEKLGLEIVTVSRYDTENATVKKVAVVNGAGSSYWRKAKKMGADLLITGDLKYHEALDAKEEGMYILDAGHYESEHFFHMIISNALKNEKDINVLRTEMFLDAEKELFKNLDSEIFFLEAPTGSGKSNVSMNLSFKILEENKYMKKIYYIYPFNTLIEQNINSLEKIFMNDKNRGSDVFNNIAVVNSINPIKVEKEKAINEDSTEDFDYKYYAKALLNRQFLNYPMILTTHVSLFNTMFDNSKESSFSFHQLANSVIVLDEIQSYKNTIWSEIIMFLKGFSKILNMKVIVMSATLPNLNYLTDSDEDSTMLIKDREKYFSDSLFKDRVEVNYDLIDKEIEEIYEHVKNSSTQRKKILVEFIKKQSAYEFYSKLKEDEEIKSKIELITGDDNSIERERILNIVKNSSDIILIATQVIEAGVDIDMDIGYKDISKLDSDEQFMGRINRSCKKSGIVYFFNVDKADHIYKNDIRINRKFTLEDEDMKCILVNKNFKEYYLPILKVLKRNYNESLSEFNISEFFSECVGGLKFEKIKSRMKLIEEDMWSMSVYLSRNIEKEDGTILYGNEIWDNYKNILLDKNLDYAKRQVKLLEARSLLNYFIYQVKKCDLIYNDRIGELYFIEDGENYFKDGKVDKDKLITGIGDFI